MTLVGSYLAFFSICYRGRKAWGSSFSVKAVDLKLAKSKDNSVTVRCSFEVFLGWKTVSISSPLNTFPLPIILCGSKHVALL
jgi:hypothetical protein